VIYQCVRVFDTSGFFSRLFGSVFSAVTFPFIHNAPINAKPPREEGGGVRVYLGTYQEKERYLLTLVEIAKQSQQCIGILLDVFLKF